jgi:hypothetical protein
MELLHKIIYPQRRPTILFTVIKPGNLLINVGPIDALTNKNTPIMQLNRALFTAGT